MTAVNITLKEIANLISLYKHFNGRRNATLPLKKQPCCNNVAKALLLLSNTSDGSRDATVKMFDECGFIGKTISIDGGTKFNDVLCKKTLEFLIGNYRDVFNAFERDVGAMMKEMDLPELVRLPDINDCPMCDIHLTYTYKIGNPVVYTGKGSKMGTSYSYKCKACKTIYYYSYYITGNKTTHYYSDCLASEKKYIVLNARTAFEIAFLKDFIYDNVLGGISFEMKANIYNARWYENHMKYVNEASLVNDKCNVKNTFQDITLTQYLVECGWFLYHLVKFFAHRKLLNVIDFSIDPLQRKKNLEALCEKAVTMYSSETNPWLNHVCLTPSCKEGFVMIDGNEKIKRRICAASKSEVKLKKGMPNIAQCCVNSPVFGNQFIKNSKYCSSHVHLGKKIKHEIVNTNTCSSNGIPKIKIRKNYTCLSSKNVCCDEDEIITPLEITLVRYINILADKQFVCSTSSLPDNEAPLISGCKKNRNIKKFHSNTAGVLCLVRPCHTVIDFTEMFTCESSNQVFTFLLKSLEFNKTIRLIGYDRACEFYPFLINQCKNGNIGAQTLFYHYEYVVDAFHVKGHTKRECLPPDGNSECQYHPDLGKFKKYNLENTPCAEQFFSWLRTHKRNVRGMKRFKFNFYLHELFNNHNEIVKLKK